MLRNGLMKENRYTTVDAPSSCDRNICNWMTVAFPETQYVWPQGTLNIKRAQEHELTEGQSPRSTRVALSWWAGSRSCGRRPAWLNQKFLTELKCWKKMEGENRGRDGLPGRNAEALHWLLHYVIKLSCTPTKELREIMVGGETK